MKNRWSIKRRRRDLARRASSSAGALRPQYLLNLGPDFVVLHKLPTISGRQANIHRLDEADVVLQISAQDLLRQFVGFQASLGRDMGKLRFLFGLQTLLPSLQSSDLCQTIAAIFGPRRNPRSSAQWVEIRRYLHLRRRREPVLLPTFDVARPPQILHGTGVM